MTESEFARHSVLAQPIDLALSAGGTVDNARSAELPSAAVERGRGHGATEMLVVMRIAREALLLWGDVTGPPTSKGLPVVELSVW